MSMNYSIHFHVWNPDEFKVFLRYASSHLPFQIELYKPFDEEIVAILRKTGWAERPHLFNRRDPVSKCRQNPSAQRNLLPQG